MIPSGFSIRPARRIDAEAIAAVHVASWKETYRGIMPQRFLDARTVKDRTLIWEMTLGQLGRGQVFLLAEEDAGGVVGFVYGGPARDRCFGPDGEIYAMYLLRRCQGLGLGRELFEACRQGLETAGLKGMYLSVLRLNPSRGFYLKMGGYPAGSGEIVRGGKLLVEERFVWE